MDSVSAQRGRFGWLHTLGAIGAILVPLGLVVSFFTSGDTGDNAAELIAYAEDSSAEIWFLQILALVAPVLIGLLVASLWVRLRGASEALRAMMLIGGTLFIRSEEHTSELQSRLHLVCRLLLEKKK